VKKFIPALMSLLLLACPKAKAEVFLDTEDVQAKKLLFIGNSFTYYYQLPLALAAMAFDSGAARNLKVAEIVQGGASLELLWNHSDARKTIVEGGPWTDVVLQEQSQRPYEDPEAMYKFVGEFDQEIRKINARTVLYQTWCDKNQPEVQNRLTESYKTAASRVGAEVVPAGDAFVICLREQPGINLYDADNHHPSKEGTYLAACVFYMRLFGRSPVGLPCDLAVTTKGSVEKTKLFSIDPATAATLQKIAERAVNEYH
jgi:hypothetical protein